MSEKKHKKRFNKHGYVELSIDKVRKGIFLIYRNHFFYVLMILIKAGFSSTASTNEPSLYVSFDSGINAEVSVGNGTGIFGLAKSEVIDFENSSKLTEPPPYILVPGIKGTGLLTGGYGQTVYYDAKENINPKSWTISFWVKGLSGKNYLSRDYVNQGLFEIRGTDGWTIFRKISRRLYLFF